MKISFVSDVIMGHCNREQEMILAYGEACADFLKKRLIQLAAAECLGIFSPEGSPPLRCTYLDSNKNQFQLPLGVDFVLIFKAMNNKISSKSLNWHDIKSIMVMKVVRNNYE